MSKIVDHKCTSLHKAAKSGQDEELRGTDSTEVIISSHNLTNVITFKWNKITKLRILIGKSTLKLNSSAYEKYEYGHLGRWYIKLTLIKRF